MLTTGGAIKKSVYVDAAKLILELLTTDDQFLRDISDISPVSISVTSNDSALTRMRRDLEQLRTISELLGGKHITPWAINKEVMANHGHKVLMDGNHRTYTIGEWTIRILDAKKIKKLLADVRAALHRLNIGGEVDINSILINIAPD